MEFPLIAFLFIVLLAGVTFVISLILRYVMFTSAEGAVKRLKMTSKKLMLCRRS